MRVGVAAVAREQQAKREVGLEVVCVGGDRAAVGGLGRAGLVERILGRGEVEEDVGVGGVLRAASGVSRRAARSKSLCSSASAASALAASSGAAAVAAPGLASGRAGRKLSSRGRGQESDDEEEGERDEVPQVDGAAPHTATEVARAHAETSSAGIGWATAAEES